MEEDTQLSFFFNLIEICVPVRLCVCVCVCEQVSACARLHHFFNSIDCVTQGQTHTFDFSKC